jgi:ABC-2 type transport system permease protein
MVRPTAERVSWISLLALHCRWTLAATWRNGEQLLLLLGIPIAAFVVMTRTELLSTNTPAIVVTTVIVVLAAGFTSPAISVAFERRYGSFAYLGTTPLPRSAIIAGTVAAIAVSTIGALSALIIVAPLVGGHEGTNSITFASMAWLMFSAVLGLFAVVPWAFLLGGTVRSETVLALANGVFIVAILFGGVLVPAESLPYRSVVAWLPTGAMVDLAGTGSVASIGVLVAWCLLGSALAIRLFRWR